MRSFKLGDVTRFSVAALVACSLFAPSLAHSTVGSILLRKKLRDQLPYSILSSGFRGQVMGAAMGHSRDRIQVHVRFDTGDGRIEEAWIHYRPDLADHRQTLMLYDADGRSTPDIMQAKTFVTLKAGVSAWQTMEHVQGEVQSFNLETPPAKPKEIAKLDRKTASALTSTQAIVPSVHWSSDCEDFIDSDGDYGKYGLALYDSLGNAGTTEMLSASIGDMPSICPNYSSFDDAGKKNFWIWLAASVAMEESSCNPEISARGPNGTVSGLWQLDLGNRNPVQREQCGSINVYDGSTNVKCAFAMLDWYTALNVKNTHKVVYYSKSYWETLIPGRSRHTATSRLVRQYQACRN